MKIGLTAETAIDLPKELLKKYKIKTVPFTIILGEESGFDGDITPDDIFAFVEKTGGLPKTSAVNEYQFKQLFKEVLVDHDEVIHFSISSKLSSAYENALKAAEHFKGKVHVIDTLTISGGIALLAIYARSLIGKGEDSKTIIEKVEKRIPYVKVTSVLHSIDYLYKGGRCSALARFGVNLFKIRPEIIMKDGNMASKKLYRGKDAVVVKKYCLDVLEDYKNIDKSIVFLASAAYPDEIIDIAEETLKSHDFKKIIRIKAGSTISAYCGDKTIGMFFIDDFGI
ncbi:MAG: DegV family protein [Bacilli bacterium]|jgi:DegV family protein with EDD domain|nr:DegV family protein [Bacilli bacterium]